MQTNCILVMKALFMTLVYTVLATGIVSLGGLLGVVLFWIKKNTLERWIQVFVALSAGVMLGVTFFDLLPESAHYLSTDELFPLFLIFFVAMFLVEKILHWRHCHQEDCEIHSFGYMNLIGDGLHNFIDGLLIAATFQVSIPLGIATTIAVAIHEIPQEITDFGVLLYAGFDRRKALLANFGVATLSIAGGVVGYFATEFIQGLEPYLLLMAGASFTYIAASDLMPELRKVKSGQQLIVRFGLLLVGIVLMWGLSQTFVHDHGVEEDHSSEIHPDDEPAEESLHE